MAKNVLLKDKDNNSVYPFTTIENVNGLGTELGKKMSQNELLDLLFPRGVIFLFYNDVKPASIYGGVWNEIAGGRALWTDTSTKWGGTIDAGLPNISGGVGVKNTDLSNSVIFDPSGAFAMWNVGWNPRVVYDRSTTKVGNWLSFEASRSSGIYGSSSTVQPPAQKVHAWVRVLDDGDDL